MCRIARHKNPGQAIRRSFSQRLSNVWRSGQGRHRNRNPNFWLNKIVNFHFDT
jgi:hypothetical protein